MPNNHSHDRPQTVSRAYIWTMLIVLIGSVLIGVVSARYPVVKNQPPSSLPSPLVLTSNSPSPTPPSPTPTVSPKQPLTLLFVGDLMFDRSVWLKMQASGLDYPFELLDNLLSSADLTIGNLEGPVTDRGSHAVPNGALLFKFEPSILAPLKATGLDLVSLANNHTRNQGESGLADTRLALTDAGFTSFGDPRTVSRELSSTIVEKNGWTIAFLGWNTIEVTDMQEEKMLELIQDLEDEVDLTVILPHWGNEYKPQTAAQTKQAEALVTAGADLIMGAHAHTVQGFELVAGKPIVYSLGNFIFDQYWSEPTQEGLAVRVTLDSEKITELSLLPIDLHRSQPRLAEAAIQRSVLARVAAASAASLGEALASGLVTLPVADTPR